jgi:hypothetical protein
MGMQIFFVRELADKTDILLNELALLLHLLYAVRAVLLLQSFQKLLVFPNDFQQLPFAERLVESLLFMFTEILVEASVGGCVA